MLIFSMKLSRFLTCAWTFICACDDTRNTFIYVLTRDRHNVKLLYSAPNWKMCGWLIIKTATVRTHHTINIFIIFTTFWHCGDQLNNKIWPPNVKHTAEQIPTFGERWTHAGNRHRLVRNNKTCTGETERCGLVSTCSIRGFIAGYHVNGAKFSGII
jgi:hypothetical protein